MRPEGHPITFICVMDGVEVASRTGKDLHEPHFQLQQWVTVQYPYHEEDGWEWNDNYTICRIFFRSQPRQD